jgi:hypothetical protein
VSKAITYMPGRNNREIRPSLFIAEL